MKKLLLLVLAPATLLLAGCEGTMTNWRGRNLVRNAEFEAQRMEIHANALIYYEQMNADALLLRAEAEAGAEVIRATGVAEAMEIIQENISEDYLQHLFIRSLSENPNVIYVATELGMPLFLTQGE